MSLPRVELHEAFSWTCDACGRDNFARAITADLSPEEYEEAVRAQFGLEPWELIPDGMGGEFLTAPKRVTCGYCETMFEVERAE